LEDRLRRDTCTIRADKDSEIERACKYPQGIQDYVDENADSDVIDSYKGVALWRTISA
jgi:hypothetical protein